MSACLGCEGVLPFLEEASRHGKGIFILVKISNRGSGELQDLQSGGKRIYERMAELVVRWGQGLIVERGISSVGAVVGATYSQEAAAFRQAMPHTLFLVHSARQVIFAYRRGPDEDFAAAACAAVLAMREELEGSLRRANHWPW